MWNSSVPDIAAEGQLRCLHYGSRACKGYVRKKDFLVAAPTPVSIRVGEVARAGAAGDTIFGTVTDFMPVRGGMGMDTGAIAGENEAVFRDELVFQGGYEGGKTENLLEPFFIMKRKLLMRKGVSSDEIGDAGMFIGKFLSSAGLFGRLFVLVSGEKIFPAGFLRGLRLDPEPASGVYPIQSRIPDGALNAVKNQNVLLSHAGKTDIPDGTASEPTYV